MVIGIDQIFEQRNAFTGTLYLCKSRNYYPDQPSGNEGRYNGEGTSAFYLADTPDLCWAEVIGYNPDADPGSYRMWSIPITGTFIDVGAVEGTQYVRPRESGGWVPTQELSCKLQDESVLGFRYTSRAALEGSTSGTCYCVYQSCLPLARSCFTEVEWQPETDIA